MIQDVLAVEGFLMEHLPSHLNLFPSQMGSLEILQSGQGPASGVYLGKDMWHHGEMTTQGEREARPGSGGSSLRSMGEARKFGKRAFGASLAPGGTVCQARSSLWEHEGCSWWWNRLWGGGGSVTQRGQGTTGALGQLVLPPA